MNYLSHFFFDKHSTDPHFILGLALPDLAKNFDKTWNIHPHKFEHQLVGDEDLKSIYKGWQKHLLVDKHFHSSAFFKKETDFLKKIITPFLVGTPVRPFILAHISLELILDSLLIETQKVNPSKFYNLLNTVNKTQLLEFFKINQIKQPEFFVNFYEKFIENAYLFSYTDYTKLVYALNRICFGIWGTNFSEETKNDLQNALVQYKQELNGRYLLIFDEIAAKV